MAKKAKTVFVCQECGYESPKWMGQCICGAWNSMVEEKIRPEAPAAIGGFTTKKHGKGTGPQKIAEVSSSREKERIQTGLSELDRVLGGGLVPGSMTLISGEPGIGKSTIIMQVSQHIAATHGNVLYVTGEESSEQVAMRAERICEGLSEKLYVMAETEMETIADAVEELQPSFVVIDSIQTVYVGSLDSAPGSVSQVRACGSELMQIAKHGNVPVFLVAHVTKNGELAGPKTVEHMVDCVLHFNGERNQDLRILRAFKNRFGTTSEIGAFEMGRQGLREIKDLSSRFLQDTEDKEGEGSVITAFYEGSRPLLMEIQALTAPTNMNFPRRTAIGMDNSRLNMILAVLERKAYLSVSSQDVYVNVAGGLRLEGTGADLAVALAIHSTCKNKVCSPRTLVLGEVGLTGEIRAVASIDKIAAEAVRMGFDTMIVPKNQIKNLMKFKDKIRIVGVATVSEAIKAY